jgi:hypothetical protein
MSLITARGQFQLISAACHGMSAAMPPFFQGNFLKEGLMKLNSLTARFSALAIAAAVAFATPASADVALNKNAHITESLVAAQVGDILRKSCSSISARFVVVFQKMNALEAYARSEGYTETEVRAFLKDKAEKARIKGLADSYLAAAGVVADDEESYCASGRNEIAKETLAGSFLMSWK